MATEISLSFSLHRHLHRRHYPSAVDHHSLHSFHKFPKPGHFINLSLSASRSPSPPSSSSTLQNQLQTSRFLTNDELENLNILSNYSYHQQLESGLLWVRVMREEELDMTVTLLSESFSESMKIATSGYLKLLEFLVKNYLLERRGMMPHNATLLGIYRENGEEDFELAGSVELTFDRKGANVNPPTPKPPKDSPYICNMAVRKPLRRRGIGWHLLKASEELIMKMGSSRQVYLHCRMIDEGPFNMYTKAGYSIMDTDSIFTWLTLQRRRHLMRKELPVSDFSSEIDFPITKSISDV